jgi:hypothetical protein
MTATADMFVRSTRAMAAELGVTAQTLLRWAAADSQLGAAMIRVNSRRILWDRGAILTRLAALRRCCPGPGEAQ